MSAQAYRDHIVAEPFRKRFKQTLTWTEHTHHHHHCQPDPGQTPSLRTVSVSLTLVHRSAVMSQSTRAGALTASGFTRVVNTFVHCLDTPSMPNWRCLGPATRRLSRLTSAARRPDRHFGARTERLVRSPPRQRAGPGVGRSPRSEPRRTGRGQRPGRAAPMPHRWPSAPSRSRWDWRSGWRGQALHRPGADHRHPRR